MKNRILLTLITLMMITVQALAQTVKISGTVISKSDGETLIGATVKEVGTQKAAITDFDGNFTIEVNKGAQLTFSYVGFESQTLPAADGMKVELSDAAELQELVVTGYQVQRKADLTGAVSVVNIDDLQKQNENNPMKALQGRVPGMNVEANGNPSGAATIRIRGNGTLNDNDPLYIIDGVPTKSGMHELNGNDIESIQVLKDAASASIYGSRAANGVIIITTKKGKNGKVKVDFDASVAAQLYAHKLEVLNTKQYGQALWQAFVNDGKNPNTNGLGYNYDWGYNANGNPVLNSMTLNKYLDEAHITPAADTDWFDETTRTGVAQQYNISLSAGSEKSTQFFSLGYYKNDGIIKQTDFERFSARMNTEFKLVEDVVTVGEHFTLNRTSEVGDPGNLQLCLQYPSIIPVYDETGAYAGPHGGYTSYENPVARLDRNADNRYKYWRTFGDVYLNVNPLKNLNFKTTFGIDYAQKEQRIFRFPVTEGTAANKTNSSEAKQEHWAKWMWNLVGTYNMEKNKHRADFLAGIELNREDSEMFSAVGNDYAIFDTNYMWPEIGTGVPKVYSGADGYTLVSFFGKANYTYNDRYMASLTIRHDGSSRFGKNNKYGTFPSFSAGWRISEEKFLKDKTSSWLDNLKLRASWGQTGNQQIPTTARYSLYKSTYGTITDAGSSYDTAYDIAGNNQGALQSGFKRIQVGNDDLKWETTTQTNIGLDFTLFHNAIYGSFEWYHKNTKDILVNMPSIAVGGEGAWQYINAGEVQNRGIEFNMGWRGETKTGISWDITGNVSTNRNEIKKLPATLISRGTFGGNAQNSIIGHAMGSQVGYVFDGIFQNQQEVDNHAQQEQAAPGRMRIKDLNGDGVINDQDQTWIYDPTPDFCYGLNVYLQYKNFDFTMFWQGVQGVDVITRDLKRETDLWAGVNVANLNKGTRLLDAWTPENASSLIPALTSTPIGLEQAMSSYYVENGSYLKLRTVQFGYNIPKDFAKKLYMERMRVYLSAQNLFTVKSKNFTGVDPENAGYAYPIPLNITFGLNVTF